MDRLDALKVFCTVAESGGFSKAAARLGISTPSVTNQISSLEEHFKVKLLNRTTRSMSLTDEGQVCYENALQILNNMGEMEAALQHSNQVPQGNLRVDMPGIISKLFVSPALPGFLHAYPQINLRLTASDRLIDMVEEGIDVLIRIGDLPDSSLVAKVLFKTRYITCASPAFVAGHGMPDTPEDLSQYPCLNFLYPKSRQIRPWNFLHHGQNYSVTPPGIMATDHIDSLIAAAVAGCGIIQVLSVSVIEQLKNGTLVAIMGDATAPGPDVSALYPQKHLRAAKVKVFVDFLSEIFSG